MTSAMFPANLSANGNSPSHVSNGRLLTIVPYGGFGGGTLTLKASHDGTTFVVLSPSITWTSANAQSVELAAGVFFRLELTGSTNPTLNAQLFTTDR